ncbi:predicted protein, partial [Nematostella vectensis]
IVAPTAPPQNVTAMALSSTSIYVTWQPPPPGTLQGFLHHYEVFLEYHADNGPTMTLYTPDGNTSLLVSSLSPHTVYYFTVQMVNIKGLGPPSEAVYNRTLEDVPGPAIIEQVRNISSTILEVRWQHPKKTNGILKSFKVCWSLEGVQGGTYLAPGTLYTLTGLGPWNEYAIQIACESAGGLGPTS